jgi:aryl-alcohol dehydrogenase-like predicted oxidoreductase
MISRQEFGQTGHLNSRIIFGSWALTNATKEKADSTLQMLESYGVNSIDTAPMYGNVEKLIGSWLTKNRKDYFVATKTRSRSYKRALKDLEQSLKNLQVEFIDLWQMHGLTNPAGWEKAMGPGGALEAFIEARDNGLVRYLGVTGHGNKAPRMHIRSLEHFDFDSVLLPYNYVMMQDPRYAADFIELVKICDERKVALQTIKSIARRSWGDRQKTHNTFFYEPLEKQSAIDKAVHWVLGLNDSFLVSVGDLELLPRVLDAASRFEKQPSDSEMNNMVAEYHIQSIWESQRRVEGRHTWGGQMSKIIDKLIREGFFGNPKGQNVEQVLEALQSNGLSLTDKRKNVVSALSRRARDGVLKRDKTSNGWVYWTE